MVVTNNGLVTAVEGCGFFAAEPAHQWAQAHLGSTVLTALVSLPASTELCVLDGTLLRSPVARIGLAVIGKDEQPVAEFVAATADESAQ